MQLYFLPRPFKTPRWQFCTEISKYSPRKFPKESVLFPNVESMYDFYRVKSIQCDFIALKQMNFSGNYSPYLWNHDPLKINAMKTCAVINLF